MTKPSDRAMEIMEQVWSALFPLGKARSPVEYEAAAAVIDQHLPGDAGETGNTGELVKNLRSSAKAFRENTVYDSEGDPVRLIIQADEADQAADLIATLQSQLAAEKAKVERLARALEVCLDEIDPPPPSCSCHITPPCGDCVDHASAREAVSIARAALKEIDHGK